MGDERGFRPEQLERLAAVKEVWDRIVDLIPDELPAPVRGR
ncbi:hypothetical protein [Kribbella alba]